MLTQIKAETVFGDINQYHDADGRYYMSMCTGTSPSRHTIYMRVNDEFWSVVGLVYADRDTPYDVVHNLYLNQY